MKRIVVSSIAALTFISAAAQIDMGVPTATGKGGVSTALLGNFEAIGVNPANLGFSDNHKFSFTLANVGMTMQSKAIDFTTMKDAILHPGDTFSAAQKQQYAQMFSTPDGFNMQANVNWFAGSMYFPKLGGLAINVRDRAFANVSLSQNAADILFNGINSSVYQDTTVLNQFMSKVLDGCSFTYLHYRELNVAYGRRILGFGAEDENGNPAIQVLGGIGLKYLWGLGNANAKITKDLLTGQASFTTNYNINYGNIQNFTPQSTSQLFNSVGSGYAMDLGATLFIKDKIRFAVSMNDIGGINWKNNVLIASDTTMPPLDSTNTGLNSWQLGSQAGFLFGNTGFMNYNAGKDYKTNLPSRMRIGYGMKLGERVLLGADVVIPTNKTLYNLEKPYMAVGGEVKIGEIIHFNLGLSGNSDLGWNVPMGLTFGPIGFFEIGLATGDVLTYFSSTRNPNLSFALGFIRFNFKAEKE
ncbi:MAG: hypothetical protein Fur0041_03680 [Bacteroidia bacterium]